MQLIKYVTFEEEIVARLVRKQFQANFRDRFLAPLMIEISWTGQQFSWDK